MNMTPLSIQSAEVLALEALAWLVANDELLPVFTGSTGVLETEIRDRATEAEFLASVLDFVMMDDAWVLAFAKAAGHPPELLMRARAALPGGAQVNWT